MPYFLAFLSGILVASAFPPVSIAPAVAVALVPLLAAVKGRSPREGFRFGFLSGLASFGCIIWWLAPTISRFGNLPSWFSWPVIGLLVAYLAIFPASWGAFAAFLSGNRARRGLDFLILPAAWTLLEWLREHVMSGFPWAELAYSLSGIPTFVQTAEVWGPYGIAFTIVLVNVMTWRAAFLPLPPARRFFLIAALFAFLSGMWGYGAHRIRAVTEEEKSLDALRVLAVQGSIPQEQKWDPEFQEATLSLYLSLTEASLARWGEPREGADPALVVWPETATPFYFQDDSSLSRSLLAKARDLRALILFGSPSYREGSDGDADFFNSAFLVGPDGAVHGRYDKVHLVPFGEYMPFGWVTAWARDYLPTAGEFMAGTSSKPLSWGQDVKAGVLICFESIFPARARETVHAGANLIAIITNDAWFGRTGAPWQHEAMAVFRAVETRRWVVRAANTGVSSIITPWGERASQSPLFEPTVISGEVRLRGDMTPFVNHGAALFLTFCILFVIYSFLPGPGRFLAGGKFRMIKG